LSVEVLKREIRKIDKEIWRMYKAEVDTQRLPELWKATTEALASFSFRKQEVSMVFREEDVRCLGFGMVFIGAGYGHVHPLESPGVGPEGEDMFSKDVEERISWTRYNRILGLLIVQLLHGRQLIRARNPVSMSGSGNSHLHSDYRKRFEFEPRRQRRNARPVETFPKS
jgi:hypothetical protein